MERYEEYKDSGVEWIGEIPEGWDVRRVKSLATGGDALFLDGDWIESDVIEDKGIRYLTTGNVGEGYYKDQGTGFISEETFNKLNCLRVIPGDLLISRLNEPLGRACLAPNVFDEYVVAVDVVVLRGDSFLNRFLTYAMNEPHYAETALMHARGSTMKRVSRTILGELKLPIPPIIEQEAIADYLDTKTAEIDALVADCEREVGLLQEYRKAVISEAVTKGLDPDAPMKDSGVEWIGEIPEGWDAVRLDKVAIRKSGHTPDKKVPEYWDGSIVWISLADSPRLRANVYVNESTTMTTEAGIANSSAELLPEGAVLLSRDASVGLTAIAGVQLAVSQHFMAYICDACLNNEYLRYVFLAMRQELEKLSMGSTIPTIGLPLMRKLTIPYPSRKAQDDIVGYLNAKVAGIDRLIDDNQSMIDKLREYRRSLISEAVTGKFKVTGVE
ncbi:MAG: restriction endonuclease subunit S [Coriobacteriia bacterium]|nr:restriction endonuclease subunit S [Coriobacteriia bacterium]